MINYQKKDKGMKISDESGEYTVIHDIFKVMGVEEIDNSYNFTIKDRTGKVMGVRCYKDIRQPLQEGIIIKVAYIERGSQMSVHGYEYSNEPFD